MWGDSACQGQGEVIHQCAPKALDMTNRRYHRKGVVDEVERAKVEHLFLVIKRVFGFAKTR